MGPSQTNAAEGEGGRKTVTPLLQTYDFFISQAMSSILSNKKC